jgi:NADPH:quinone reductase-like Zn-dependent oxidoreductase
MLRSLGADEVIDFTREDFTQHGVRYDLIFDVPGNHPFSACRRALTPDGKYVLIGHEKFGPSGNRFLGLFPRLFKLIFLSFFTKELQPGSSSVPSRTDTMAILKELLQAGKLTPIVDSTYPLNEAREAFRHMFEDETMGKVIIIATRSSGSGDG